MKHFKKTVSIISLGAVMAITGCSSDKEGDKEKGNSGDQTLTFMTPNSPLAPQDPNEKLIFKRLEEKTGIHIDWKVYSEDVYVEKRNLALATGELPDALFNAASVISIC